MASALDMSLEDIIKTQKSTRRSTSSRGSRGAARSSGPTRHGRSSRDNRPYQAGVQQYRATPVAPINTAVLRQSVPDGSKMQVSNLDHRVTSEDLKLVFTSRIGPLKKCTLMYDQNGKSNGTALVHFTRVGDAAIAMQKFNGVPLDGRPMRIELVIAPAAAQAVIPPTHAPRAPAQHQRSHGPSRGGRGGSGRGRGGRSRGEKRETKTADQLDAEMNDYMQGGNGTQAITSQQDQDRNNNPETNHRTSDEEDTHIAQDQRPLLPTSEPSSSASTSTSPAHLQDQHNTSRSTSTYVISAPMQYTAPQTSSSALTQQQSQQTSASDSSPPPSLENNGQPTYIKIAPPGGGSKSGLDRYPAEASSNGEHVALNMSFAQDDFNERRCRICFETDDDKDSESGRLISPCLCKGSSRYIHLGCLEKWRKNAPRSESYYACDTCHYKYSFGRPWIARVLGCRLFLHIITALMFFVVCYSSAWLGRELNASEIWKWKGRWDESDGDGGASRILILGLDYLDLIWGFFMTAAMGLLFLLVCCPRDSCGAQDSFPMWAWAPLAFTPINGSGGDGDGALCVLAFFMIIVVIVG
ncbi:hypothetical protein BG011_004055 [Mortierella polycephala]|uniref:RING-CH-type domain-containing protein n=1 Tax=Mortierella polycephala TaxID=41804 RepID=A0A9P6U374_9FUNG|nr:hypothetical protein BG011_004055 [Mortierella polycephala]